jgi:hypothetical protein
VLFLAFIYNYLYLYPIYNPIGGVRVLEEAWNLLSSDVEAIFRIAESNLDALNTVDSGLKRPFGAGECALWARLTGPQFAAQVGAVVSLVEASANHRKATTVAKEVMAIKYSNQTSHSITKFLESPSSANNPSLLSVALSAKSAWIWSCAALSPPAAVVATAARPVARVDDCRPLILSLRENFREGSLGKKKNLLAFANALTISLLPWLQSFVSGRSRWRRAGYH